MKPYYDDLEQAYEEQRFKVINGGGGQNPEPSPTPAPESTPIPFPTTVPVPGDIPTFKELVAPALAGTAAFINMTQGAWECMGKAVSKFWNNIMEADTSNLSNKYQFSDKDLIAVLIGNSSYGKQWDYVYRSDRPIKKLYVNVYPDEVNLNDSGRGMHDSSGCSWSDTVYNST